MSTQKASSSDSHSSCSSAKTAQMLPTHFKGTSHPDMPPPRPIKKSSSKHSAAAVKHRDSEIKRECIAYMYSSTFEHVMSTLPAHEGRSSLVHSLIMAYDHLLTTQQQQQHSVVRTLQIVEPVTATMRDMLEFHDRRYLELIYRSDRQRKRRKLDNEKSDSSSSLEDNDGNDGDDSDSDDSSSSSDGEDSEDDELMMRECGLEDDAHLFEGVTTYMEHCAGASLTAARLLNSGSHRIAVNFEGGRHHAKRGKAAGFCYVNDVVLSILELLKCKRHKRVLCVDMDVHHGDGQEQAFLFTDKVLTLSFHQYAPGLYPGTGSMDEIGRGRGENYNVNVPLKEGMDDESFVPLFKGIVAKAMIKHRSNAIVLVCGVDGLASDPLGSFNLTHHSYEKCMHFVLQLSQQYKVPLLVLGGGGYSVAKAASCFASVVGVLQLNEGGSKDQTMRVLPDTIPMEATPNHNLEHYAPFGFQRYCVRKTQMRNQNDRAYLTELQSRAFAILDKIKS